MKDKNSNLMIFGLAAILFICAVSLLITYFTFNNQSNSETSFSETEKMTGNSVQMQAAQNINQQENEVISNLHENPVISPSAEQNKEMDNADTISKEAKLFSNMNPQEQEKIGPKLKKAQAFIENRDFEGAERVFNEIAAENRGTIWEEQAKQAILNLKNITQAVENSQTNIALGNLKLLHNCLSLYISENGKFPEVNPLEKAREFFDNTCGFSENKFFRDEIKNVIVIDASLDYKIEFELNSGQKYTISSSGISPNN